MQETESKEDKILSNMEKIRKMTDEEFAEFLEYNSLACQFCNYNARNCGATKCIDGILEWLHLPYAGKFL